MILAFVALASLLTVLRYTRDELPYSTAVVIEQWDDPPAEGGLTKVHAAILVDGPSQKPIVIGKGGAMIKRIGSDARKDLERLLGGGSSANETRVATFQDWRVVCPPLTPTTPNCVLTQDVLRDTGGILMTLNITDPTNNASLSVTVPHGVGRPHPPDVVCSSSTIASSSIVGISSGASTAWAKAAASSSRRRASSSLKARCGDGPFTVQVAKARCVTRRAPDS